VNGGKELKGGQIVQLSAGEGAESIQVGQAIATDDYPGSRRLVVGVGPVSS